MFRDYQNNMPSKLNKMLTIYHLLYNIKLDILYIILYNFFSLLVVCHSYFAHHTNSSNFQELTFQLHCEMLPLVLLSCIRFCKLNNTLSRKHALRDAISILVGQKWLMKMHAPATLLVNSGIYGPGNLVLGPTCSGPWIPWSTSGFRKTGNLRFFYFVSNIATKCTLK